MSGIEQRGLLRRLGMLMVALLLVITVAASPLVAYAGSGDNYPEPWRSDPMGAYGDSWGYFNRNCTSWVAWALHDRNGFETPRGLGNAMYWGTRAASLGYRVDTTPAVGAVAWWPTGEYGHVAWVKSVNQDNSVVIEEYNYGNTGRYNVRTITTGARYIHFKDMQTSGWQGVGGLAFKGGSSLSSGQRLGSGEYLMSPDGYYVLAMQQDGNLVTYTGNGHKWSSGTGGNSGAYLAAQTDGNVVIYSSSGRALWNTKTTDVSRFIIQNDGNLVGYTAGNNARWWTGSYGDRNSVAKGTNKLLSEQQLHAREYLRSVDGRYTALMQSDGNLVVYAPGYKVLWNSGTNGNPGAYARLQQDGNFVIYNSSNRALWSTRMMDTSPGRVEMQSDGNFVQYSSDGKARWFTHTENRLK